jgi:AraC-like DNA-binding protein
MELFDEIAVGFYAAASGVAALSAIQASIKDGRSVASQSAVAFAALLSVNCILNVMWLIWPSAPLWLQNFSAVSLAGLTPFMWLYVDDITSPVVRTWKLADIWKFWTVGLALTLVGFAASLPQDVIQELTYQTDSPSTLSYSYFFYGFFVQICILLQSSYYVWQTIKRLSGLSEKLQHLFSDAVDRRPTWLWLVISMLGLNWLVTFIFNFGLLMVPSYIFGVLAFAFAVSFSVWSIRQRPTFLGEDGTRNASPDLEESFIETSQTSVKYERSLLPEERLERIASKIAHAFTEDALHLNPVLSLSRLSKHLSIPEQHLSQTFTRRLNTSFYDYVNLYRIQTAKTRLKETDELIVDIAFAVGYNSRSAFYNAFKAITGQTPSDFRATP